jgi:hypothetical protein
VQADPQAWSILREFAASLTMTLPVAEEKLKAHLGDQYQPSHWSRALQVVTECEDGPVKAQQLLEDLARTCLALRLTIKLPARPPQIIWAENRLMESVAELRERNRVHGDPLSIEELVNPAYENLSEGPLTLFSHWRHH